jgi:hypothetical protein
MTWLLVTAIVLLLAAAFLAITHARPSFDAMGFMTWGRQVLHWNLNTDGAPSWKPLPFLFTLPYALVGRSGQQWLWTETAAVGGVASIVLAARLAFRLTPQVPGRAWARAVAASLAAFGIATMTGYLHLMLIANSDPLIVLCALGAIDAHLSGRHRLAIVLVWLVALGRPECWLLLFGYAVWMGSRRRADIPLAVVLLVLIAAWWFVIPGLTSKSWFGAGNLALGASTVIHGNKFVGVADRLRTLAPLVLQITAALAVLNAIVRRDRPILVIAACGLLWAAIEIAFSLHGWSATQRYLMEPGAVLLVVAAAGVGSVLAQATAGARWLVAVAMLALIVALVPFSRDSLRTAHGLVSQQHTNALVLDRLQAVVDADGATAIRACGQPVALLGFQSTLAWMLGMNVGTVGFHPGQEIDSGQPIVFFQKKGSGWDVRAVHPAAGTAARCAKLARTTTT